MVLGAKTNHESINGFFCCVCLCCDHGRKSGNSSPQKTCPARIAQFLATILAMPDSSRSAIPGQLPKCLYVTWNSTLRDLARRAGRGKATPKN